MVLNNVLCSLKLFLTLYYHASLMLFSLFLLHFITITLLFYRWRWWIWWVPLLCLWALIIWWWQRQQHVDEYDIEADVHDALQSYWILAARTILLVWIRNLLHLFWLISFTTWFWLLWFHLFLRITALVMRYKDIERLAHWWRRLSWLIILFQTRQFKDRSLLWDVFSMLLVLWFALYAAFVFIWGAIGLRVSRSYPALLVIFSQITLIIGIAYQASTFSIWTWLGALIYLGFLYLFLERVGISKISQQEAVPHDDLLRRILRGQDIADDQWHIKTSTSTSLLTFIQESAAHVMSKVPSRVSNVLWSFNGWIMLVQLWVVLWWISGEQWLRVDIAFWVSSIVYIMNYFILQRQQIALPWQRALTFLIINFGVYLTMYHLFGNAPLALVICGIIWSVCNAVMMIFVRQQKSDLRLTEKDYQYWLFGNMAAICANSYFIILLPLSAQLRFTLIMIYLSLQALLLNYQLKK